MLVSAGQVMQLLAQAQVHERICIMNNWCWDSSLMAVQALCWLQLLEHGANVHNHGGGKTKQTPLHLAVADLNMDAGLIELLVSYGASPFLEASDGVQPFVALTWCILCT